MLALLAALGIYALAGSPTPDHPGAVELAIAVLLICATGLAGAVAALRIDPQGPPWRAVASALLVYGLSAALVVAVCRGNAPVNALRDLAPFIFLLLPLFLAPLIQRAAHFRALLGGVLFIGILFSLRATGTSLPILFSSGELTYFANAPTVLFTALFIAGWGGEKLLREFSPRALVIFVVCAAAAIMVLLPVMMTMQRASLGYAVFYIGVLSAAGFFYYPLRMLAMIAGMALLLIPAHDFIAHTIHMLAEKTSMVGFNARGEELAAVWAEIAKSPLTMLLGTGWGGMFESPAVAGIRVNFTHSLLSSALLKTGLAGLILTVLYIFSLMRAVFAALPARPVLVLALMGPVVIDTFLYASFKSLDFGLILLLAAGVAGSRAKVA